MSALLPAASTLATRRPSSWPSACTAIPYDPDWVTTATPPPPRGRPAAIEAFSGSREFCTPKQLGPTSRTPPDRAAATASACSFAPSSPASAKPALSTTAAATLLPAAARMMPGRWRRAWPRTARSTGPGTSRQAGVGDLAADLGRRADRHHLAGERRPGCPTAAAPPSRAGRTPRPGRPGAARTRRRGRPAGQHAQAWPSWWVKVRPAPRRRTRTCARRAGPPSGPRPVRRRTAARPAAGRRPRAGRSRWPRGPRPRSRRGRSAPAGPGRPGNRTPPAR